MASLRAVGMPDTPDGAPAGIEVVGLGKRFGPRTVLDDVTFSVPAGEVFGLVGANGSGKTTLLRILATLLPSDEGEARVNGASVGDEPAAVRASMGFMPAFTGRYPRLTAQDYVVFYAGVHRLPRARRPKVAGEVLELVGLADHRHDEVDHLSRGHKQRLGLARALVHDPSVLLLDDTSGFDPSGQADLRALLHELRRAARSTTATSARASWAATVR